MRQPDFLEIGSRCVGLRLSQPSSHRHRAPSRAGETIRKETAVAYIEGFVVPVPEGNQEAYRRSAADAAPYFKEYGVLRHVEAWQDDVPKGEVTDFFRAVNAEPGEVVVFSWFEYPSRAARDAANQKMMSDQRLADMMAGKDMPFDGQRMVYGGFEVVFDNGGPHGEYVDGALVPYPAGERAAVERRLTQFTDVIKEYGSGRTVRAYSDDIPDGKVTDFKRSVKAEDGEGVVFMWIEWPSKAARDEAWGKISQDPRMREGGPPPFDAKRWVMGGFRPIFDS
jgi:uncharacterized protein YbaA (DUF1428 family)